MKNKRYKIPILAASFYAAYLLTVYSDTQMDLVRCERKYGIEKTVKAGEFWLENYEKNWYFKPFKFTKKWAVESYIKNKNLGNY